MSMLAAVRPNDWDLPLLIHVAGAMVLVGTLVVAGFIFVRGGAGAIAPLSRFGFRTLLFTGLPAYIAMRVGGEWIASKEDIDDATWLDIGYMIGDAGILLFVITLVTAGLAARDGKISRVATVLTVVLLAASLVAVWAMTAKPD